MILKDLIKNCQHNSFHYTYLIRSSNGNVEAIEKKTFDEVGVESIDREAKGLKWYARSVNKDPLDIIECFEKTKGYCKIKIKYHNGKVISCLNNSLLVENEVKLAVDHYLKVFGRDNYKYSHGDYFIGNIVYNNNSVMWVFDWEHFNSELPPGYDAVNFITEIFLSSYQKRISNNQASIKLAKELLLKISNEVALPKMALKTPVMWCRDTALNYKHIWGIQYNKLPHIASSYQTCLQVDKLLGI